MVPYVKRCRGWIVLPLMLVFLHLILMAGVAMADSQGPGPGNEAAASQPATTPDQQALGRTLRNVLYILLVLVVLFAVSSYAFILWSRRYKRWLLRHPTQPTPHQDVWPMHKLPPELTESDETEPEKDDDR